MPTTDGYFKGTIGILPINKEGPISVKIDGYTNDVFFSTQTIEYNTTLGQSQYYIDSKFDELDKDDGTVIYNINVSIAITASSPVMLIFEAPFAQTSNVGEGGSCGTSCYYDSIQFMPISSQPLKCNSLLMPPDQRIITNDFTTRLHVYSPNLEADCYSITNITVYDGTNNVQGTSQIVDEMGFTKISLMNEGVVGFSTTGGQVPTNRFGSILGEDGITAFGHFMHYVPSISEWVTGKTQFFTLSNNCVIEFYTDSSNENLIKIDGKSLATLKYDRKSLPFFQNQYFQFIVKITGYGLHKIEHDAKYVAYVVCKHVNGPNNAAGYLTGFNQRKST
uniref:IgGFc_binding domain-containing protein n=1 Tax=Rhabditophanes sp. KR3021 TaxID=114890 RepID=A0AC35UG49_9BILA